MTPTATHPLFSVGLTGTRPGSQALVNIPAAGAVAALTRKLAQGEEMAFREFHAQYFDRLYQFLLMVARGKEHEAQEALQETMVRVARSAKPFETEEVFWCWLKAIARNAARDAGRRQTRYLAVLRDFAFGAPAEAPAKQSSEHWPALLKECLAEMAADDGELLAGKYLQSATVRELSAQTGLTEKSIESRLLRARRELRERLLRKLQTP